MQTDRRATPGSGQLNAGAASHRAPEEEVALVAACLRGDPEAIEALIAEYGMAVRAGAALALVGRAVSCTEEDLESEFFLGLLAEQYRLLAGFTRKRGRLGPWLAKITYHRSSKLLRSSAFRWPGRAPIRQGHVVYVARARSSRKRHPADLSEQLLEKLDERSRWLVRARFGLWPFERPVPVRDIATQLGCTRWQVYHRVCKVLEQVRTMSKHRTNE